MIKKWKVSVRTAKGTIKHLEQRMPKGPGPRAVLNLLDKGVTDKHPDGSYTWFPPNSIISVHVFEEED